ncbi:MAG: hypothetical protein RLZZ53_479 [Acidobacteriota bacterium]|jgi:hypothetical protein
MRYLIPAFVILGLVSSNPAVAQTLQLDAHVTSSKWSEFDSADNGFGGRLTFKPVSLIGIEADVTWYPSEYEPDGVAFSRNRTEGLLGITVGPKIDRIRPFAKVAAGFLKVGATPGAFACIAIFPPPLNCSLASGDTLQAYEVGGGIEFDASRRFFIRADIADRILKYPGPTFDDNFKIQEDGFFGHAVRFTLGAGIRF